MSSGEVVMRSLYDVAAKAVLHDWQPRAAVRVKVLVEHVMSKKNDAMLHEKILRNGKMLALEFCSHLWQLRIQPLTSCEIRNVQSAKKSVVVIVDLCLRGFHFGP